MSRRKQLKPQPVKDDAHSATDVVIGDEKREKKRRLLNDVKSEPSSNDDEMKSMSTNGDLKLDCQFCGTSYESISDLQTHTIREHVPMPIPSLECQHCFAVLPSFAAFVIHMRGHLSDREDTRCSRCPLTFSDTQEFQEHVMSHSNELVSLACGPCRINFESHELLAMHVQLIHDKEQSSDKTNNSTPTVERNTTALNNYNYSAKEGRILHCSVCDEKCYGEDALDEHRLFSHCKVMVNRYQLNVHLMEHDDRRCCPHCLRPFALAQHLLTHVVEEHNEEQPLHCCTMCDESFRFSIQLENHMLKHVSEPKTSTKSDDTPPPSESFTCQQCTMVRNIGRRFGH
ncbi:unnamed protein product [Angiostrongylus costaricensis]|uniref:C2H2-type domain-containing protein n=1 Tax=Angiostrongylus costaricensis TaxID=334426 RepID=A0A158PG81_ANGCS|nr:unnamed protein product [Angiostrongylus costaricensis]